MSTAKPGSGWGGRRPGAGAPKGNFNGLKHGLRSKQVRKLAEELALSPVYRRYLQRAARLARRNRANLEADRAAAVALSTWLRYIFAFQAGEPIEGLDALPPFSQRQIRRLARLLARQAIKQGLYKGIPARYEEIHSP